jgi:autotransporter-associated beta strand protein
MVVYNSPDGLIEFYGGTTAGSATFNLTTTTETPLVDFTESSTAGEATFNADLGSTFWFRDTATAGSATFNLSHGAQIFFFDGNSADNMVGNCIGGNQYFGSGIIFQESSKANSGTFTTFGGQAPGEKGGEIDFDNTATADTASFVINGALGSGLGATVLSFAYHSTAAQATIVINGGNAVNADGGTMYLRGNATAANATITVNGGSGLGGGGLLVFEGRSSGGAANVSVFGNGELAIGHHLAPGVSIGSLAGDGLVFLGNDHVPFDTHYLTVGGSNLSTAFTGLIDGRGGITKAGTGAFTLTGENTYSGRTTVEAGTLTVSNQRGSGTGTGAVNVEAGTLAGSGILAGPVTVGTGTGSGAILAPSATTKRPVRLVCKETLTFDSDSSYNCALRLKHGLSQHDEVIAKGVTINGAQFNLVAALQGQLAPGTSFTVLSNTASTPISGTFANLADGATLTAGNTKLQASYEGGDGNDLNLTVVP